MMKIQTTTENGPLMDLRPFFKYFGSKWRLARSYPPPKYPLIIEPFAGGAGYSVRWHNRNVILNDIDPRVHSCWNYLVSTPREKILKLPLLSPDDNVSDLQISQGARNLIGLSINSFGYNERIPKAAHEISKGKDPKRSPATTWSRARRDIVAKQVKYITHWESANANYKDLHSGFGNPVATWFIDPVYESLQMYKHSTIDYDDLAEFCLSRNGQVIVCEREGASWLPFEYHRSVAKKVNNKNISREVIYTRG